MKRSKLLAALLCVVMTVTSLGMDVKAATEDILTQEADALVVDNETTEAAGDTLISEDEGSESLVEAAPVQEALVSEPEPETRDELIMAKPEGPEADEGDQKSFNADGREDPTPFDNTNPTLTLLSKYSSLADWEESEVIIPACVTFIPADTTLFLNNKSIQTVKFESSNTLTDIEAGAFMNSSITSFAFPNSLKVIEDNTFQGCESLESVTLNKVTSIGNEAFKGCKKLNNSGIVGGDFVVSIGDYAFQNAGFTTVAFTDMAKGYIEVGKGLFKECLKLTQADLPSGFDTVPEDCFDSCEKLQRVKIGSRTRKVEKNAFHNCISLTEVVFGTVETIETRAFDGCSSITTIDLPETVFTIEEDAFNRCDKLKDVYIRYKNNKTGIADDMILPDSLFWKPNLVTIHGCGGLVEKYANAHTIGYVSLLAQHEVSLVFDSQDKVKTWKFARSTANVSGKRIKATAGETVGFQFEGHDTWVVIDISDKDGKDLVKFNYVASSSNTKLFQFTMPDRDLEIKLGVVTKEALKKGTYTHKLLGGKFSKKYNGTSFLGWETDTAGNQAQLEVTLTYDKKDYILGPWVMTYRATGMASVDKNGVITAVAKGDGMVGFKPMEAAEQAFGIYVVANPSIDKMEFDYDQLKNDFEDARYGSVDKVERTLVLEKGKSPVTLDVPNIIYFKEDLNNMDLKFDLHLLPYDDGGFIVSPNAEWKVDDEKIAKLATKNNYDNKNTVTVKKGCSGETFIRATVKIDGVEKYAYAVLTVINRAPRLDRKSYYVNTQCVYVADDSDESLNSDGAVVEVIATADYDIDPDSIASKLYTSTNVNATDTYSGIVVTYIGESPDHARGYLYRLSVNEGKNGDTRITTLKENQSITFKGKNQLYLRGVFTNNEFFYIPIEELTIFNQKLKPKVSQTGSINIFYNSKCYEPENNDFAGWQEVLGEKAKEDVDDPDFESNKFMFIHKTIGEINVLQSIKKTSAPVDYDGVYRADEFDAKGNSEIADYVNDIAGGRATAYRVRLMSDPNYAYFRDNSKRDKRETKDGKYFDSFANNFNLSPSDSGENFTIRRSYNPMAQINGKDVTSGYLLIYYKGYKDPIPYRLVLSISNKGPQYTLSPASANDSWLNYVNDGSDEIPFRPGLFLKKTTNSVLENDDMVDGYPFIDQAASTRGNGCIFNEEVTLVPDSTDKIHVFNIIKNQSCAGKSKAIIVVKKTWWDKELNYTYTVNESSKEPTGKFAKSKLELNRWFYGTGNERDLIYTVNLGPCTVDPESQPEPVPRKKQDPSEFSKLTVTAASAGEDSSKLKITAVIDDPSIEKGNYDFVVTPVATYTKSTKTLKEVKFTISVVDKQPTLKLTTTNFNFNIDYPGVETYKPNASFGNIPNGGQDDKYVLDAAAAALTPKAKAGTAAYEMAEDIADKFTIEKFEYNEKTKKFDFFCKLGDVSAYPTFSCQYELSGLTIDGAEFKPLKVTLKSNHGVPSIKLKATGTINSVEPDSHITLKPTIKNLVNPDIEEISYKEYDKDARNYLANTRFEVKRETDDDKDTTLAYVSATHDLIGGKDSCTNEGHRVIFTYKIKSKDFETAEQVINPIQNTPVLSPVYIPESATRAVFYNNAEADDRVATIEMYKTTVLNADIVDAADEGFIISDKNSTLLQSAFTVEYSDNGKEPIPAALGTKKLKAGEVVLKCTAPSLLTAGKTYDLILEPKYVGQFEKSKARTVTVKVEVR